MRRKSPIFHVILVTLATLLSAGKVGAENDFFSETVMVSDRGDAELRRAASEALTKVFVRISGNEAILDDAAFEKAVGSAQQHVVLYSYADVEGGVAAFFEFDDAFIRGLFRDESVFYWEQRRPPLVVWLALDEPFSRRFAARSDDVALLTPSLPLFKARGVDVRFPLLDLVDAAALPVDAVWQRDFDTVRRASLRYGSEHSLVGRWIDLSDGSKLVNWYYVGPDSVKPIELRSGMLDIIWNQGVDLAVDAMRDSLAVRLQQFDRSEAIAVSVEGVSSYADYRAVSKVFKALAELVDLRIDAIDGDTLTYRVVGVSTAEQVARLIPSRSGLSAQPLVNRTSLELTWEAIQ